MKGKHLIVGLILSSKFFDHTQRKHLCSNAGKYTQHVEQELRIRTFGPPFTVCL